MERQQEEQKEEVEVPQKTFSSKALTVLVAPFAAVYDRVTARLTKALLPEHLVKQQGCKVGVCSVCLLLQCCNNGSKHVNDALHGNCSNS